MGTAWKLGSPVNVTVGTAAQALSDLISPSGRVRNFTLQADDDNSNSIFVGDSAVVTGGTEAAELVAGASYASPSTESGLDISTVYVVGGAANQTLRIVFWEGGPYA